MSSEIDPYYKWLGIPPSEQPPNHYRLLVITLFENNSAVIESAANRQMTYLQQLSSGEDLEYAQKLLGEVSRARVCLLNAEKKSAYDKQLRRKLAAQQSQKAGAAVRHKQPAASAAAKIPSLAERSSDRSTLKSAKRTQPQAPRTRRKKNALPLQITLGVVTVLLIVAAFLLLSKQEQERPAKGSKQRKPTATVEQPPRESRQVATPAKKAPVRENTRISKPKRNGAGRTNSRHAQDAEQAKHAQATAPDATSAPKARKKTELVAAAQPERAQAKNPPPPKESLPAVQKKPAIPVAKKNARKTDTKKPQQPAARKPSRAQNPTRKRQLAAAEEELEAQGLVANDDAEWEPEEFGKAYRELSAPKEGASERELWKQILELQELQEELGKDLATRQQNPSIQENLEILDTTLAPVPEFPTADWVKTTAEAYLMDKKSGLQKLPDGLWEPKLAESCRTLQAELIEENNRYRTTFEQSIEAQKAKWQKEFNKVANDPFNPEYIRLGKLLPHSPGVSVNGNSNKPPHPQKVILKMAKKEMRKDPKFKAKMAAIQTAFEEKNSQLKNDEKQLQNRYKKIPKDKNIRLALQILDQGLAPDLPESDPLVLTTDPSRPPSPVGLAAKKAIQDLTAAKRDPSSPGLGASEANYEELQAHFEPLGDEQADSNQWRHGEERPLTQQLAEIKSRVGKYKAAVNKRIEMLGEIQTIQTQLDKAEDFSKAKLEQYKPVIQQKTAKLAGLKNERDKSTPETKEIVELLIDANKQARQIDVWNQKYEGFTDPDGSAIEIKTTLKRLEKELDKQQQAFVKAAKELRKADR